MKEMGLNEKIVQLNDSVMEFEQKVRDFSSERDSCLSVIQAFESFGWELESQMPETWFSNVGSRTAIHIVGEQVGDFIIRGIVDVNDSTPVSDFIVSRFLSDLKSLKTTQLQSSSLLFGAINEIAINISNRISVKRGVQFALISTDTKSGQSSIACFGAVGPTIIRWKID